MINCCLINIVISVKDRLPLTPNSNFRNKLNLTEPL